MSKNDVSTDLSKLGLEKSRTNSNSDAEKYKEVETKQDELFNRDPENLKKPWWKMNFLLTESIKFGTWDGVFTTCMINIFGVVVFLRSGWMVGYAGLCLSVLIVVMAIIIGLIAMLSAIGICERCQLESGGVLFLLSHVLGSRLATSVAFPYCFGQTVASSLYAAGFGESISDLLGYSNQWISKGIAVGALVALLGINLTGVKWVIRLQLILVLILTITVLDFLLGSFIKFNPSIGIVGYHVDTFRNNTFPSFTEDITFFSVFGVFFPTITGVCAGINMSGDLSNPKKSIPVGTLAAIGVSFLFNMCFTVALAGTCTSFFLQRDNMMTSKVALIGPLFLFGLYVSSLSAALGGMSTAPRLLRAIAETTQLPGTTILAKTYGENKVPVFSLLIVVLVTITFIFIGNINILGPIVTIPFLMTYAALSYAYFVLAKSFDIRKRREDLFEAIIHSKQSKYSQSSNFSGILKNGDCKKETENRDDQNIEKDVFEKHCTSCIECEELDKLFPERLLYGSFSEKKSDNTCFSKVNNIIKQPRSCYSVLINRWISLLGTTMFLILMFAVDWRYSLICLGIWFLLYLYIGYVNPGLFPGIAEFSLLVSISNFPKSIHSKYPNEESELLISTKSPHISTIQVCVTDESLDYINRDKYHQAQIIDNDRVTEALAGDPIWK